MSRPHKVIVRTAVIAVAVFVFVYPALAGTSHELKCSNCDFNAFMVMQSGGLDGRLGFETVAAGYCCKCKKVVAIGTTARMTEEERKKAQEPIGEVFSFETGKKYTLYACPDCGKPFIAMDLGKARLGGKTEKLFCPKCGKQTVEGSAGMIME